MVGLVFFFFCKVNKYFLFMCQYLAYVGFFWLKKESCFISQLSLLALIAEIPLQTPQISKSDLEERKLLLTEVGLGLDQEAPCLSAVIWSKNAEG